MLAGRGALLAFLVFDWSPGACLGPCQRRVTSLPWRAQARGTLQGKVATLHGFVIAFQGSPPG